MKTLILALALLAVASPALAGYCDQSPDPPPQPAHYISFTVESDSVTQAFVVITRDGIVGAPQNYLIGVRFDREDWIQAEGEPHCYMVDMTRFFASKPLKPNTVYRAAVELISPGDGITPEVIWSELSSNYTTLRDLSGGTIPRPPGTPILTP